MNEYEVWSEGYRATGEARRAIFHGKFKGRSFREAVEAYKESLSPGERKFVNLENLSYWACKFYDNEKDARKNFG